MKLDTYLTLLQDSEGDQGESVGPQLSAVKTPDCIEVTIFCNTLYFNVVPVVFSQLYVYIHNSQFTLCFHTVFHSTWGYNSTEGFIWIIAVALL